MTEVQVRLLDTFRAAYPNARYKGRGWGAFNSLYWAWEAPKNMRVEFYDDGRTRIISYWGSSLYYDKWEVDPGGRVRYLGSLDEPRYPPEWLVDAPGLIWPRGGMKDA